jgi:PAS domain S-box-containing protein
MQETPVTDQELLQEMDFLKQKTSKYEQSEWKHNETIRQYQSRLEAINDWVWEVDKHGFYRYSNKKVKDLLGYEPEDVIGKKQFGFMPLNEAKRVAALFKKSAKSHQLFSMLENINHHRDGREIILETNATPIFDAKGDFAGYRGIDRDITERKRAETALRESEKRYRMLADNATDVIYVQGLDMKYKYVSPSIKQVRGFPPEELVGRPISSFMKAESMESVERAFREELEADKTGAADPNRTRVLKLEMLCKDGSTMWTEIKASFLRDDNGEPAAIMGIARDITERKLAEEALHESETRFKDLVEMLPEIVFELDIEGRLIYGNRKLSDLLRYSPENIERGLWGFEIIAPEDRDRFVEKFIKWTKGEEPDASEYIALRKDGSTFPALFHMSPKTKGGKLIGLRGIMIDITQHKRMEEEKKHSEKLSAALEMAGTICHEFNQPLQAITGYTELLSMGYEDNQMRKTLEKINNQVQRMGSITKRLMGLEKYSSRDYMGTTRIADIDLTDENTSQCSNKGRR